MALTRGRKRVLDSPFTEKMELKVTKKSANNDKIKTKESVISKEIKLEPVTPPSKKKASSSPKKLPKKHLEEMLSHIKIPADKGLPKEFIKSHTSDFIEGIKLVIEKDPTLYPVIVHKNFIPFLVKDEEINDGEDVILKYWYSLISSIISQQISGAAAQSIENRFKGLFDGKPTPKETLQKTNEELRAVGLSNQKVKYVTHISEVFTNSESNLSKLSFYKTSSLEEIIAELTTLKGIGTWSAKMFAMFTLKEMDVFAEDDLGIARGMSRYLARRSEVLNDAKLVLNKDEARKALLKRKAKFENTKGNKRDWVPIHDEYVKQVASNFCPHRTAFSLILWRLSSTNIEVLENTGIDKN